jgi:hypothetical protein
MEKIALFVFKGDAPCFVHVMLNAIDMLEKGLEVKVILEGESSRVLAEISRPNHPMHATFEKTKRLGLLAGACKACAHAMGTLDAVANEELALLDDMHGHAGMAAYIQNGFRVITF